ncbi:MAG: protein kinase [Planctomycetota bacterium]
MRSNDPEDRDPESAAAGDADTVEHLMAARLEQLLELPEERWSHLVDSLCDQHPGHAQTIRARFRDVRGLGGTEPKATEPAPDGNDARFGSYRLMEQIGRGGQATVHLAEDLRLRRRVALKVYPHATTLGDRALQRLRREAEIVAKLDHAGICPIFEIGEARGVPYIAMPFVQGEPLSQHIADARRERGADGSAGAVSLPDPDAGPADAGKPTRSRVERSSSTKRELEKVLRLMESAARTVQAAHAAGVVHRDIKPGNIMVTASGEPVILDFGLAHEEGSEVLTRTGDVLGTPTYMAPEQVRGDRGIDHRVDVYALGATLFECLTLRCPFESATLDGLYHEILSRPHADPRRLNPTLPVDLKVVLDTALEKDPDRRYQSAQDLAEDLRRLRQNEPILARPVGNLERLRKWAGRNPALAGSLGAALLFLSVGLVGTSLALREAIAQRDRAEQQARRADDRAADARRLFRTARETASFVVRQVSSRLERETGTSGVRSALLQEAYDRLAALVDERSDDPAVQLELALTNNQLAELAMELGDDAGARPHAAAALAVSERLVEAAPDDDVPPQESLCFSLLVMADLERKTGDLASATAAAERATEVARRIATRRPTEQHQHRLAEALNVAGSLALETRDLEAARRWLVEARTVGEEREAAPADADHVALLARIYRGLAHVARDSGDAEGWRRHLEHRRALAERALEAEPRNPRFKNILGVTHEALGNLHMSVGDRAAAVREFRTSLAMREELVEAEPGNTLYRGNLSVSYNKLGSIAIQRRDYAEAEKMFQQALQLSTELAEREPTNLDHLEGLSMCHRWLSNIRMAQGEFAAGLACADAALEAAEAAAKIEPNARWVLMSQSDALFARGEIEQARGDLARAAENYRRALAFDERLAAQAAGDLKIRQQLVTSFGMLGTLEQRAGAAAAARQSFERALTVCEEVLTSEPGHVVFVHYAAMCHERLAEMAATASDVDALRRHAERSLEMRRSLAGRDGASARELGAYAGLLLNGPLESARNPARAQDFARRAVDLSGGQDAGAWLTLAEASHRLGDREGAMAAAERAIELLGEADPKRADALRSLERYRGQ